MNRTLFTVTPIANAVSTLGTQVMTASPVVTRAHVALTTLGQRVTILDQNLHTAINGALGRDQMSTISQGDMLQLSTLDISNRGISNLTGMEYAKNLTSLNAQSNLITSTAPLSGLTGLTSILLAGNPVTAVVVADNDVPTLPEWGVLVMAAILILIMGMRSGSNRRPGGFA